MAAKNEVSEKNISDFAEIVVQSMSEQKGDEVYPSLATEEFMSMRIVPAPRNESSYIFKIVNEEKEQLYGGPRTSVKKFIQLFYESFIHKRFIDIDKLNEAFNNIFVYKTGSGNYRSKNGTFIHLIESLTEAQKLSSIFITTMEKKGKSVFSRQATHEEEKMVKKSLKKREEAAAREADADVPDEDDPEEKVVARRIVDEVRGELEVMRENNAYFEKVRNEVAVEYGVPSASLARNDTTDESVIAMIDKEEKDGKKNIMYRYIIGSAISALNPLEKIRTEMVKYGFTDSAKIDFAQKAYLRSALGGDSFEQIQELRRQFIREGVSDAVVLDNMVQQAVNNSVKTKFSSKASRFDKHQLNVRTRTDEEIYHEASEPIIAQVKDGYAFNEGHPKFDYVLVNELEDTKNINTLANNESNVKLLAKNIVLERLQNMSIVNDTSMVKSTYLSEQEKNVIHTIDPNIGANYDSGSHGGNQYMQPLNISDMNLYYDTVDKRMLRYS